MVINSILLNCFGIFKQNSFVMGVFIINYSNNETEAIQIMNHY